MAEAATAVGLASFGIQVCQGLLTFYDGWKDYKTDIANTYNSEARLETIFRLISTTIDAERYPEVQACLTASEGGLVQLDKKLQKLRTYHEPKGFRQSAWAELQKAWYPMRASTLMKLQEISSELQQQLALALQALHLDVSIQAKDTIDQIASNTSDTASKVNLI